MERKEELGNSLSHGAAALASLAGLVYLIVLARENPQPYGLLSAVIYGTSMVLLFTASTVYHFHWNHPRKLTWQVIDHISIYILIAGTYTPFSLVAMHDRNGWIIFILIWSIALAGTVYKVFFTGRFRYFSLAVYLLMSWLIIFDMGNFAESVSRESLFGVLLGGGFYTVGAIFYSWDRLRYNHFIWHVFVIGGGAAHYFAVLELYL